ncbi:3-oxoacyl-[acyl-carrier-protein] synthase III C-terminal domain-containing protein [Ureibacillus sp. FSL W7-1570]|uniref:type III polyketide synthase n=1 Tax=Ureibacillus sp. FSL W7-1570 TaxID=2954593 RepID=UPI003159B903
MPKIVSVSTHKPQYTLHQHEIEQFTKALFQNKIPRLERLLKVFENGEIKTRHFCVPLEWHKVEHTFEERNELYIQIAVEYSVKAIQNCLQNEIFLNRPISTEEIDAIFFVSSTGISTPSIDARIMNKLKFSDRIKRLPIWGLGCVGGASGISRAFDYCLAHPKEKVLVVCVELCSLTFQRNDYSKSNLVGASLFADGTACALVCGDEAEVETRKQIPYILRTASKWMPDSENVMGWDIKNDGFHVIFSKDIPTIISNWLGPFIQSFFNEAGVSLKDLEHFIAHPGGKKVLLAYQDALQLSENHTALSKKVLQENGNMSSPTVLYVLDEYMKIAGKAGAYGLLVALGPGFSGEAVLLQWRD